MWTFNFVNEKLEHHEEVCIRKTKIKRYEVYTVSYLEDNNFINYYLGLYKNIFNAKKEAKVYVKYLIERDKNILRQQQECKK